MDGEMPAEPELDGLSLFLPLPYRVAVILLLGMDSILAQDNWLVAWNIQNANATSV